METKIDRQRTPSGPMQQRSRERCEHILTIAEELLLESGGDAFKMSDLVARSGVPFGSLYQYFANKSAVIGELASRYNAVGRQCVSEILMPVQNMKQFLAAIDAMVDGFYQMYRDYPVMKSIWEATQADPDLKRLDEADVAYHASMVVEAYQRAIRSRADPDAKARAQLVNELMASAVRQAIKLDESEAEKSLMLFKQGIKAFFPQSLK
jgi:AcrR family transcriptional regulator